MNTDELLVQVADGKAALYGLDAAGKRGNLTRAREASKRLQDIAISIAAVVNSEP